MILTLYTRREKTHEDIHKEMTSHWNNYKCALFLSAIHPPHHISTETHTHKHVEAKEIKGVILIIIIKKDRDRCYK